MAYQVTRQHCSYYQYTKIVSHSEILQLIIPCTKIAGVDCCVFPHNEQLKLNASVRHWVEQNEKPSRLELRFLLLFCSNCSIIPIPSYKYYNKMKSDQIAN